jgi:hypothetical protein
MSFFRHTAGSTTRAFCRATDRGVVQRRLRRGSPGVPSQYWPHGPHASLDRQLVRESRRRLQKQTSHGVGRRARATARGVAAPRGPCRVHRGAGATTLMKAVDRGRAVTDRAGGGRPQDGMGLRPGPTQRGPSRDWFRGSGPLQTHLRGASVPLGRRRPNCPATSEPRSVLGSGPLQTGRPTAGFGGDPRRSHGWGGASTSCSSSGSRVR